MATVMACFANATLQGLPFCDPTLPASVRAADLVQRMSVDEKISQLSSFGVNNITAQNEIPRLGVARYTYHNEGLHGLRTVCKDMPGLNTTTFPQVTGMAATGNLDLILEMGIVMGDEGRAVNNIANGTAFLKGAGLDYWGPTMNIGRDPRWGRFQESISECPWLNGAYAAQFVKGIQGAGDGSNYTKIAACCKHYYAYSLEDSDGYTRHTYNAVVSARDLAETYLVPFKACAAVNVESVMCSYNSVNGVPTCLDGHAQNTVLRGEFGFDGMIVSDCGAMDDAWRNHNDSGSATNATSATARGIRAGTDMNCGTTYSSSAAAALSSGQMSEVELDAALVHTFTMRMRLGTFDRPEHVPYTDPHVYGRRALDTAKSRALALQAATESIVLLRNDAGLLPLLHGDAETQAESKMKTMKVGVLGPTADDVEVLLGGKQDYCPAFRITPLAGLQARADRTRTAGMASRVEVLAGEWLRPDSQTRAGVDAGADENLSTKLERAAEFARGVDVVVLCLGGRKQFGVEGKDQNGSTSLPFDQLALARTVLASNPKKVVVVMVHGNPIALDSLMGGTTQKTTTGAVDGAIDAIDAMDAHTIVDAFEGGQSAGDALASVLFGDESPSGVLPWTVYPSHYTSQVKMTDMSMRAGGIGRTYRFYRGTPTFPFFYGLSYTSFEMKWASRPAQNQSVASLSAGIEFVVSVTNKGKVSGGKVVAAFVKWQKSSTAHATVATAPENFEPLKTLFALQKVRLSPGETKIVRLGSNMLEGHCSFCSVDDSGDSQVRPGTFTITIGDGGSTPSSDILKHQITGR